jgi:hypothetical protein
MLNRLILLSTTLALGCSLMAGVLPVQAQGLAGTLQKGLNAAAPDELKQGETDPATIAGNLISAVLGLLGAVLLAYLLYGGYKYMTARGESEEVKKAIGIIKDAIIGLVIIVLAYAISSYVIAALAGATSKPGQ